ncbi:hypothetical protein FB451DRAFT_1568757 [Mycena latifolia]|nr:hypothetical protein FB451DRAFT_1568757 [Mycena latifolia]
MAYCRRAVTLGLHLGVEFGSKLLTLPDAEGTVVKLQCWDIAGTEWGGWLFTSLRRHLPALLRTWLADVPVHADGHVSCLLAGNKVDLWGSDGGAASLLGGGGCVVQIHSALADRVALHEAAMAGAASMRRAEDEQLAASLAWAAPCLSILYPRVPSLLLARLTLLRIPSYSYTNPNRAVTHAEGALLAAESLFFAEADAHFPPTTSRSSTRSSTPSFFAPSSAHPWSSFLLRSLSASALPLLSPPAVTHLPTLSSIFCVRLPIPAFLHTPCCLLCQHCPSPATCASFIHTSRAFIHASRVFCTPLLRPLCSLHLSLFTRPYYNPMLSRALLILLRPTHALLIRLHLVPCVSPGVKLSTEGGALPAQHQAGGAFPSFYNISPAVRAIVCGTRNDDASSNLRGCRPDAPGLSFGVLVAWRCGASRCRSFSGPCTGSTPLPALRYNYQMMNCTRRVAQMFHHS